MRAGAFATIVLAACGTDDEPRPVTVHTGTVLVVAVDPNGDGAWQRLDPEDDAIVVVGSRWLAVSVCGDDVSRLAVHVRAYGPSDGDDVTLPCRALDRPSWPLDVTLSGATAAQIDVGPSSGVVTGSTGAFDAYEGTWDLYAGASVGGVVRGLIRRDVVVEAGASVAIDFTADGFDLERHDVTATGEIGALTATALVDLGETHVDLPFAGATSTVLAVPSSVLEPGDVQTVRAVSSQTDGRAVFADTRGFDVALPPPLDAVAISPGLSATWETSETWDEVALFGTLSDGALFSEWLFTTAEAGRGAIELPALDDVPGMDPAWLVPDSLRAGVSLTRATAAGLEGAVFNQEL